MPMESPFRVRLKDAVPDETPELFSGAHDAERNQCHDPSL